MSICPCKFNVMYFIKPTTLIISQMNVYFPVHLLLEKHDIVFTFINYIGFWWNIMDSYFILWSKYWFIDILPINENNQNKELTCSFWKNKYAVVLNISKTGGFQICVLLEISGNFKNHNNQVKLLTIKSNCFALIARHQ